MKSYVGPYQRYTRCGWFDYWIMIEDDGKGISTPSADDKVDHYGLNIMSERAKQIDGEIRIDSEPGEGTQVILQFKYHTSPIYQNIPVEFSRPTKRVVP